MIIYFDENMPVVLANGFDILIKGLYKDVEVRSIKQTFGAGTPDEKWIPIVGQEGAVVITQDLNIGRKRAQIALFKAHQLGIVFLVPPGKGGYSYWAMVEQIVAHWPEIYKKSLVTSRPFAFDINPRSFRQIQL